MNALLKKIALPVLAGLILQMFSMSITIAQELSAPLYAMVRSLQYVQDSVVAGDLSAMDMQRFLLEEIDQKLRQATPEDFDDPRNVDAALIYAMSGGNPRTLDLIVARDRFGYFDEEITGIMRAYLNGLVPGTDKPIEQIVDEYLNTALGPYVALIAGNVRSAAKDISSIEFFNLARLAAPGSLIEESALRRSILISINHGKIKQAVKFAHIYARRFSKSPYNVQFSQLIIEMIVQNLGAIDEYLVDEIIAHLPQDQQKRIYLRIARSGVVDNNLTMAAKAMEKIGLFEEENVAFYKMLAELYYNISNLPQANTQDMLAKIKSVKRRSLPPADRPLHDAALLLAEQILNIPTEESLAQAMERKIEKELDEAAYKSIDLKNLSQQAEIEVDENELPGEEEFTKYLEGRSSTIDEIDALLEAETQDEAS